MDSESARALLDQSLRTSTAMHPVVDAFPSLGPRTIMDTWLIGRLASLHLFLLSIVG